VCPEKVRDRCRKVEHVAGATREQIANVSVLGEGHMRTIVENETISLERSGVTTPRAFRLEDLDCNTRGGETLRRGHPRHPGTQYDHRRIAAARSFRSWFHPSPR